MADNIKIRTEDVQEILDTRIKTGSAHLPLDVSAGEYYDSVLEKISDRSPTFDEKAALAAAENPSVLNPYTTLSRLNSELAGRIPWVSVGPVGSGADFEGNSESPLVNAILSGAKWIALRAGEYVFSSQVSIPGGTYLMGATQASTQITANISDSLLLVSGDDVHVENISISQSGSGAAIECGGNNFNLNRANVSATEGGTIIFADGLEKPTIACCRFEGSTISGKDLANGIIVSSYFNTVGVYAIDLENPTYWSISGCNFNGQIHLKNADSCRVIGNHLNDGVFNEAPVSVVLRGNTPTTTNNESEDFADLLQYIGSPSVQDTNPLYSNNFAGPQGESLTARAGALDLLTQWRYEDRNLQLIGAIEPSYVVWDPINRSLATTSDLHLISSHRESYWVIPQLGSWTSLTFASQQTASQTISFTGDTQYLGQTFVSPYRGDLKKVTVRIKKSSGATGTIRCALVYLGGGQVPSSGTTSLGHTLDLDISSLSSSTASDVALDMSTAVRLENGSSYAVVFQSTSPISGQVIFSSASSPGSYSGGSVVQSSNGGATWTTVAQDLHFKLEGESLSAITLNDGEALYYKLDRNMTSSNVTLVPYIAPIGSIANDVDNRNTYVLAYCHNRTIWWRGGNGSRLTATNNEIGTYHIDGTSKTLVDYLGATDTNDFYPQYSDNFSGLANEPILYRISKTDERIRTLYEYSNMVLEIETGGKIALEGENLSLLGNLYFYFPHINGRFKIVNGTTWNLPENTNSVIFAQWDQSTLYNGADIEINHGVIVNGTLPMPENDGRNKYFIIARRVGYTVQLWDGTELIPGSQWPVPSMSSRFVMPTSMPDVLEENIIWDGQHLLWENIALALGNGLPLSRNSFANKTSPEIGLTDVGPNQGILVTHTWNAGADQEVVLEKVLLPLTSLRQNQFIWVQNFAGTLIFGI